MGYIFHSFWFSNPNCVAIWAYKVGLLTPVQVIHRDQPQIQPGSLKLTKILVSSECMTGSYIKRSCFKLNEVQIFLKNSSKYSVFLIFSFFFFNFSPSFYFKGARPKTEWLS
jgi:hypothetical protein